MFIFSIIGEFNLSKDERQVYRGFGKNFPSMFEVLEVISYESLKLKDLIDLQEYWIKEEIEAYRVEKDSILNARIAPFEDHFLIMRRRGQVWPQVQINRQ